MGDKQCEIMMRFEDVFGCGSPMRETGENKSLYLCLCALVCFKTGGKHRKEGPDVLVDWGTCDSFLKCVFLYPAATVHMSSSYLAHVFPHCSSAVCDYPAAFNTCSSHRENTPLSLEDDEGVGSAAS